MLDQCLSLAEHDPELEVRLLAPHTPRSRSLGGWPRSEGDSGRVTHQRFGYAPRNVETLTERGIMPAIRERAAMVSVVPLLLAGEQRALMREVREQRPDVIYAHWFTPQAIIAWRVSRRTGVPFGFTTHASDVAVLRRLGAWGRRIVHGVTRDAAFMTAVSQQTAAKLLDFFDGDQREQIADRLVIAPMGVDLDSPALGDAPEAGGAPARPGAHTVCVVARLVEKKGIHVLLEAWPQVKSAVPDAILWIGGDGPWRERLEHAARDLEDVHFAGYVTGDGKRELEARAAIAAVPSVVAGDGDSDGFPVSAIEAFARGAFVVASDASGVQDVLVGADGEPGTIVPAGDPAALAEALIEAMQADDEQRESRTARARQLAESLSWPTLASPMLTLLKSAREWTP